MNCLAAASLQIKRREMWLAPEVRVAVLRYYLPSFWPTSMQRCFLSQPEIPLLDLCDWYLFYLHPACTPFEFRAAVYKQQGVWFMDDDGECRIAYEAAPVEHSTCCDAPLNSYRPCLNTSPTSLPLPAGCAPRDTTSQVVACRPLRWRMPTTEAMLYSCDSYGTALIHGDTGSSTSVKASGPAQPAAT